MEETSCKVNAISFEDRFQQFETEFIGNPIDDLKLDSTQVEKLKSMKESVATIAACEEGRKILAKISNMHDGLGKYIVHEYENAINYFDRLPNDRALTHQLLGAANQKRSQQFDPSSADWKKFRQAADGHSEQFMRLADKEIGGLAKQSTIHQYVCNVLSRPNADAEAQARAKTCLEGLISDKLANHNTFYNLAVINARLGNCKETLNLLKLASTEDRQHAITRKYITDIDGFEFKKIVDDPQCKKRLASGLTSVSITTLLTPVMLKEPGGACP